MSTYRHQSVKVLGEFFKKVFIQIYEKIIINEHTLAKIKALCKTKKGPIIFCPTHRSYIDFLLLSVVLFFYNMELPHICAGEDFL